MFYFHVLICKNLTLAARLQLRVINWLREHISIHENLTTRSVFKLGNLTLTARRVVAVLGYELAS